MVSLNLIFSIHSKWHQEVVELFQQVLLSLEKEKDAVIVREIETAEAERADMESQNN